MSPITTASASGAEVHILIPAYQGSPHARRQRGNLVLRGTRMYENACLRSAFARK